MTWLFESRVSLFQMGWSMFFIAALVMGRVTETGYCGYMLAGMAIEFLALSMIKAGGK
jgi:hypothetical protein